MQNDNVELRDNHVALRNVKFKMTSPRRGHPERSEGSRSFGLCPQDDATRQFYILIF